MPPPRSVRGARQAGLDHRRRGQVGDVEDGAGSVAQRHGLAQHAVGQPGDDPHVVLSCLASSAISRFSASSSSAQMTAGGVRDARVCQARPRCPRPRPRCRASELLDDAHPECVVAADDGVALHAEHALRRLGRRCESCHGPRIYVKACINGARTPDQHPNLPVTPAAAGRRGGGRAQRGSAGRAHASQDRRRGGLAAARHRRRRGRGGPARGTRTAAGRDDGLLGAARCGRAIVRRTRNGRCCPTSRR